MDSAARADFIGPPDTACASGNFVRIHFVCARHFCQESTMYERLSDDLALLCRTPPITSHTLTNATQFSEAVHDSLSGHSDICAQKKDAMRPNAGRLRLNAYTRRTKLNHRAIAEQWEIAYLREEVEQH